MKEVKAESQNDVAEKQGDVMDTADKVDDENSDMVD